ncbi:BZ3500_MvSof-1268-A1-R1_Chr1-3g01846 [Microbotryum saponariae]|uniref:BZ3500_MvSof-1268-A1-R1_Chr1-3g01846 protein n=1 Tax=Microbotryum saponariae TaxID=289078 RepID=A0A2X0MS25_9BASI|nr:BZ3500_MvSof-1268-A1-R1_Chr1-3g01846 [Microbotryum saponariae]SCZ94735.1 BZ3501_MvSof-1269-A2-R1_Chr1-3g01448 [Microbotryum saponariae]
MLSTGLKSKRRTPSPTTSPSATTTTTTTATTSPTAPSSGTATARATATTSSPSNANGARRVETVSNRTELAVNAVEGSTSGSTSDHKDSDASLTTTTPAMASASSSPPRTTPTATTTTTSDITSTTTPQPLSPTRIVDLSSPTSSPVHSGTAAVVAAVQHSAATAASSSSPSSSASSSSNTASPSSPSSPRTPSARRVKLYRLRDDAWEDLGTGTCAVHLVESAPVLTADGTEAHHSISVEDGSWIIVRKEVGSSSHADEGEVLLRSKVMPYPPGYLSDDDDDLEVAAEDGKDSPEGKVIDAGGYQRQQDTLIVWTERETDQEMALSFATAQGCHEIWQFIKAARKWSLEHPLTSPSPSPSRGSSPHPFQVYAHQSTAKLTDPTLGNLHELEHTIRSLSRTAVGRERTASTIVKSDFIQKLIRVHEEAEDLESLEDLHALCRVMQTILLLNDNVIFELVLRDEVILGVVSILECRLASSELDFGAPGGADSHLPIITDDPEFPTMKASYRAHLADPSHFTQVVPIRSPALLAKIHQTHRLHYLKDVVLARVLEDSTFSMLNSAIYFNEVDIVNEIAGDPIFLRKLFALFDEEEKDEKKMATTPTKTDKGKGRALDATQPIGPQLPSSIALATSSSNGDTPTDKDAESISSRDRQLDAILFLQQFATMAKNLQIALRAQFFRSLADRGLLRVLEVALARSIRTDESAPQLRGATIAILMTLVDHDPNNVRSYSLKQHAARKRPLMGFLIDLFLSEEDLGLKAQMSEALRVLVDAGGEGGPLEAPPRMRPEDPEAEKFLQYFYDHCAQALLAPILKLPDSGSVPLELSVPRIALCSHLCDLLCFFIAHHTFRSKYFVLSSSVATNVAKLFQTRHKHLRLAALRFFRACIQRNDDFYNRFLIKNDLFRPILDLAVSERDRDNLLGSACLDFFEFIKNVNAKGVISHIVERYGDKVRLLATTLKTFESVVIKYEQNKEPPPAALTTTSTMGAPSLDGSARAHALGSLGGVSMSRENSTGWAGRMDVEEDESYFNGSDDEDEFGPPALNPSSPTLSKKRPGEEEDEQASSPERQKRAKLEAKASSAALLPLVDYGEDEDEPLTDVDEEVSSGEGGFIKDDPPVPSASQATSTTDKEAEAPREAPIPSPEAPPPPLLSLAELKKKKDEEDDGALGFLNNKKSSASTAAARASNATNRSTSSGAAGGIKISLGASVKGTFSRLGAGSGASSSTNKKKE